MRIEYTSRVIRERTLRVDTGRGAGPSVAVDAYINARLWYGRRDRIGVRERECVAALLTVHYQDGKLSTDEFHSRFGRAADAVYREDLDRVMRGLPPNMTHRELTR